MITISVIKWNQAGESAMAHVAGLFRNKVTNFNTTLRLTNGY